MKYYATSMYSVLTYNLQPIPYNMHVLIFSYIDVCIIISLMI